MLNRVGSPGHEQLLREALAGAGVAVLGAIPRDDRLTWRDRHLGLVPVAERPGEVEAALDGLAALLAERCDLAAIAALAAAAPPLAAADVPMPEPAAAGVRLAVAGGPAFSFTYPDNLEALAAAGAELVPFDPCSDAALPEHCRGLVAGGGFPEVFAGAARAPTNPCWPTCAGRSAPASRPGPSAAGCCGCATSSTGRPMAGAIAARGRMTDRLTLGYRSAVTTARHPARTGRHARCGATSSTTRSPIRPASCSS